MDELKEQLNQTNSISISTDASNHGAQKLFPIVVRFFIPNEGIQVKILEFEDQPGETSDIILKYLMKVLTKYNLTTKIVAFCGDNTNCNFGGKQRKGVNNVYAKLNSTLGKKLIGIGCGAHVIHNAIKTAADCLPIDLECVLVKIYSHFYIYNVRVETLKAFCDDTETEYKKLLGYIKFEVLCEKCQTNFSVAHGGASDIEQHFKAEKHKKADVAAATSATMHTFFKSTNSPDNQDLDIAAAEGTWAYHTVQENHSFRSNDCASKIIQCCFEKKFTCARTKCEAIVTNIIAQTGARFTKLQFYKLTSVIYKSKFYNC